jgi:hypothetical protein
MPSINATHKCCTLTISCPGCPLGVPLVLGIHISPNNGPMDMILSGKLIYFVNQSISHVQSCKSDHWLPSYGVDLIADFVRAALTLQFSPNFV